MDLVDSVKKLSSLTLTCIPKLDRFKGRMFPSSGPCHHVQEDIINPPLRQSSSRKLEKS